MVAAIYARISLDRHDGEGVARQLADCRHEAARRGWDATEYVDNDISAHTGKHRPQWERLLTDLHDGRIDAVIAYHPDRLYRRLSDLERLITAIEAAHAQVVTIRAGDIDLATATGRMTARIIGAVAAAESERTGERVARAKAERAAQGRPAGGGRRPYGLTADRRTIVADEATWIRRTATAILSGSTYGTQVRRLNHAGQTTTTGRPWTTAALRRVLTSPHVAGLRSYHGDIVANTITPPILDRDTWDALRLTAAGRQRPGRPPSDQYLLTGLLRCADCDRPMYATRIRTGSHVYRCSDADAGKGCGRSITMGPLDHHVMAAADAILTDPAWQAAVAAADADTPPAPSGEVAMLERRRNVLAARWAAGEISDDEYDTARAVIVDRLAQLEQPAGRSPLSAHLAGIGGWWRDEPAPIRRSIVAAVLVTPIRVRAGWTDGRRVPVADRVDLTPRA